eukprot:scaffold257305_cov20-Prasinocladus_malaysianus.AAC.1
MTQPAAACFRDTNMSKTAVREEFMKGGRRSRAFVVTMSCVAWGSNWRSVTAGAVVSILM